MNIEESVKKWSIIKYKQIKREGRVEEPVSLVLDQTKNFLSVYSCDEQLEHVFYNMEVSKFPVLRFSDHYLYILFNGQGQGFRLTFLPDQKVDFMRVMQRLAYITESPAKRKSLSQSPGLEVWPTGNVSGIRNLSSSSQSSMPPLKRNVARNLNSALSHYPDYRPPSSSSSTSSQSFSIPDSTSSQLSMLSISPSPPNAVVKTVNKCIQTDGNLLEELANDDQFAMECMRKLIEDQGFQQLVSLMKEAITQIPDEELLELRKNTEPKSRNEVRYVAKPVLEGFPMQRNNSDMEYDIFEEPESQSYEA